MPARTATKEGGRTRRAITLTGRFTVQRKINGWRKRALGLLYYPQPTCF